MIPREIRFCNRTSIMPFTLTPREQTILRYQMACEYAELNDDDDNEYNSCHAALDDDINANDIAVAVQKAKDWDVMSDPSVFAVADDGTTRIVATGPVGKAAAHLVQLGGDAFAEAMDDTHDLDTTMPTLRDTPEPARVFQDVAVGGYLAAMLISVGSYNGEFADEMHELFEEGILWLLERPRKRTRSQ